MVIPNCYVCSQNAFIQEFVASPPHFSKLYLRGHPCTPNLSCKFSSVACSVTQVQNWTHVLKEHVGCGYGHFNCEVVQAHSASLTKI